MSALEAIAKQAQDYYREVPVIILGSGASAAFGMSGMAALATHLLETIDVLDTSDEEKAAWKTFCDLLSSDVDLETALLRTQLSPETNRRIAKSTWDLLNPEDLLVFNKSLEDSDLFPLGRLLSSMLRSTQGRVNVITTNYDRLAEYSCDQAGIHHYTGFSHGYRRRLVSADYITSRRQVNILKVHGSLDWFADAQGVLLGLGSIKDIPTGLRPLIVTPGVDKYRGTQREPFRTIIHETDNVLSAASAYLCIGFGFNDEHIQEKLIIKCASQGAKITVITYKLTDAARQFLLNGVAKNFLAIESGDVVGESIVYSSALSAPISIQGNYWSLSGLLNLII